MTAQTSAHGGGRTHPMTNGLRVLIVNGEETVRQGMRLSLHSGEGITVCGEAGSLAEAARMADELIPEVVIADVRLADPSGIESARALRDKHPGTHLLFLIAFADEEALLAAILAGASGYLLEQVNSADLVADLRAVTQGSGLLDLVVRRSIVTGLSDLLARHRQELSVEEEGVLSLIGQGETDVQIAATLGLSVGAVKRHVADIVSNLRSVRSAQAADNGSDRGGISLV